MDYLKEFEKLSVEFEDDVVVKTLSKAHNIVPSVKAEVKTYSEKEIEVLKSLFVNSYIEFMNAMDMKEFFLHRQRTLMQTYGTATKALSEYEEFTNTHTPAEVSKEFTNIQLNELSNIRNQIIPSSTYELEEIARAIVSNNHLINESLLRSVNYLAEVKRYSQI